MREFTITVFSARNRGLTEFLQLMHRVHGHPDDSAETASAAGPLGSTLVFVNARRQPPRTRPTLTSIEKADALLLLFSFQSITSLAVLTDHLEETQFFGVCGHEIPRFLLGTTHIDAQGISNAAVEAFIAANQINELVVCNTSNGDGLDRVLQVLERWLLARYPDR